MPAVYHTAADQVGYTWTTLDLTGKSSFQVPRGAVIGGQEHGKPTYVARVERAPGQWEVAKLNNWCKFGYGYYGKEVESSVGDVLVATEGQEAAWMSSAFGEHINGAISVFNGTEYEMIARTYYNHRWIPGKVITEWGLMYFSFGGKELQRRQYQLLLGSVSWQRVGSRLPRWLVPVDQLLPSCMENSIQHASEALQEDKPPHLRLRAEDMRLVQQTLDECQWVVSGDGADVRNAVMLTGHQIGRKFISSRNQWVCGWVHPSTGTGRPGLHIQHAVFGTYEVLTANSKRMQTSSVQLSYSAEDKEGQLTSPNEVFLVTKVAKGESMDAAYHEMMDSFQACQLVNSLENSQRDTASEKGQQSGSDVQAATTEANLEQMNALQSL